MSAPLPATETEASAELARLAEQIAYHNARYHTEDAPEISDAAFDALRARNTALEAAFPQLVRADSPSRLVGAPNSTALAKVPHARPMLSLDNAFSVEELEAWHARLARDGVEAPALLCERPAGLSPQRGPPRGAHGGPRAGGRRAREGRGASCRQDGAPGAAQVGLAAPPRQQRHLQEHHAGAPQGARLPQQLLRAASRCCQR